jgi:catechol 2,3-dioxygenase-like lactoylglutathione lyase family enzyme
VGIAGAHMLLYAEDPDAARAFCRDVLGFSNVDAGGGWLIFALPPAELGIHPVESSTPERGRLELWLMCQDLPSAMAELAAKGVTFTAPIEEARFGSYAPFVIPGAGTAWLYQPNHASPLAGFSD